MDRWRIPFVCVDTGKSTTLGALIQTQSVVNLSSICKSSPSLPSLRLIVALPSVALATQWTVGDDNGWTANYNYTDWAKDKVFQVGDSLLLNYQAGNHNVFKVNLTDFRACNIPPAYEALATGHDVTPLVAPGVKWYICGIGQHRSSFNQKLRMTVVDNARRSSSATGPSHAK